MSRTTITGLLDRQTQLVSVLLETGLFERQDIANLDHHDIVDWYLVTDELANRLTKRGYIVLTNEYGTWWGAENNDWIKLLPNIG